MEATAVYVPSLCLTLDGLRLTAMNEAVTRKAAKLVRDGYAAHLIFSTAYDTWEREAELRKRVAAAFGIKDSAISIIPNATTTYDESAMLMEVINRLGVTALILVTDKWHMPRAALAIRIAIPKVRLEKVSVTTPRYERTHHPAGIIPKIKSIRDGSMIFWILFNLFFFVITPLMMRREKI